MANKLMNICNRIIFNASTALYCIIYITYMCICCMYASHINVRYAPLKATLSIFKFSKYRIYIHNLTKWKNHRLMCIN